MWPGVELGCKAMMALLASQATIYKNDNPTMLNHVIMLGGDVWI